MRIKIRTVPSINPAKRACSSHNLGQKKIKQNSGEYLASVLLVEFLRSVTANELNIDMKSVDQLFRLSI
jgi:hypothetical protein